MSMLESAPLLVAYGHYIVPGLICYLFVTFVPRIFSYYNGVRKNKADRDDVGLVFRDSNDTGFSEEDQEDASSHIEMEDFKHVPFSHVRYSEQDMVLRSRQFYEDMNKRRSLRFYSDEPVPLEVIRNIVKTAGTGPSGAHTEPWSFVVVSNKSVKSQIREIVEEEEQLNYRKRMGDKWVNDLARIATTWEKPYLDTAPFLVLVFKQTYGIGKDGRKINHYYNEISVCISVGLMLAAIQNAGLVTLTSTPMNAGPQLRALLDRPANEKVILLLPIGYPADGATVPDLNRKPLDQVLILKD